MRITSWYPVIMSGDVAATAAFYVEHLDFRPLFTSDWYVHLQSVHDETVNLAVLDGDHETIPESGRGRASGLLLTLEVDDVDAVRQETQRLMVQGDPHPIGKYRVIGPLSNMPEFQKAFGCGATAPMVRPPDTRCQVW